MSSKARAKGTSFETLIKEYLWSKGFKKARRSALAGAEDTGDIHGLENPNRQVCIQCKNDRSFNFSGWLNDTVQQAERLSGALPVLVVKRQGKGAKSVGESYAVMRLDDLVSLLEEAHYT